MAFEDGIRLIGKDPRRCTIIRAGMAHGSDTRLRINDPNAFLRETE